MAQWKGNFAERFKQMLEEEKSKRVPKLESLYLLAAEYRDLWLICHEQMPREPTDGEYLQLGHLRGRLFAAIDKVLED